jgi:hypothetical protein
MTPLFVYPYICEFVMYGFCTMDVWNTWRISVLDYPNPR